MTTYNIHPLVLSPIHYLLARAGYALPPVQREEVSTEIDYLSSGGGTTSILLQKEHELFLGSAGGGTSLKTLIHIEELSFLFLSSPGGGSSDQGIQKSITVIPQSSGAGTSWLDILKEAHLALVSVGGGTTDFIFGRILLRPIIDPSFQLTINHLSFDLEQDIHDLLLHQDNLSIEIQQ